MKKTLKQGFFIFLALGLMMGMTAEAGIVMNDIVCAFSSTVEKSSIEDNISAGATYFLASKANADLLLMEYEKASNQKLDIAVFLSYATMAIGKLETARGKYILARDIGKRIGYIEYKCAWFKNFDMSTSENKQSPKNIVKHRTIFQPNNNNRHHHSIIEPGSQCDVMFH
jgi:hypothetical protein